MSNTSSELKVIRPEPQHKPWYKCTSCERETNDMDDYMTCPFCGGDLIDNC